MQFVVKYAFVFLTLCSFSASSARDPVTLAGSLAGAAAPIQHHLSDLSAGDLLLMIVVAVALIGHQMRRKHRFMRIRPFGI